MSTLDDIAKERQRIGERLARLDGERAKLAEQLGELEAAERVVSRFSQNSGRPRRGRPPRAQTGAAQAAPAPTRPRQRRRARGDGAAAAKTSPSLGDAVLRAIEAHGSGASADEVRTYLQREFGMQVRPNHLGMALQRHRRSGRLEQRDSRWWIGQSGASESSA